MAEVDRLETIIGLEEDPANPAVESKFTSRLSSIFEAAKTGAVALGKGVLASAAALSAWTVGVASSVAESSKFARESGIAYEKLQEWEYAAKASGVSTDALRGDITKLYKDMNQLWPSESTWRMGMYGIKTKDAAGKARDAGDVLVDLSAKMQGLSTARQLDLGQKLGLSDDTMRLLRQGPDAIKALGSEARALGLIIPESAAAQAEKFMTTMRKTRAVMEGLAFKLGIAFLPAMSQLLDSFSAWIVSNQEWISLGIQAVADGVAKSFEVVGHIISGLVSMFSDLLAPVSQLLPGLEMADVVSMALTAAFAGLIAIGAVIIAKFVLIGLAVGVVAAIIEDLVYFIQGKPSLFGEWWEDFAAKYPGIASALRSIGDFVQSLIVPAFNLLKSAANLVATAIGAVIDMALRLIESWLNLGASDVFATLGKYAKDFITDLAAVYDAIASFDLSRIGEAFSTLFAHAMENLGEVALAILRMFGNIATGAADAVASAFSSVFEKIKEWFTSIYDWVVGKFDGLKSMLPDWMGGGEDEPAEKSDQPSPANAPASRTSEYKEPQRQGGYLSQRSRQDDNGAVTGNPEVRPHERVYTPTARQAEQLIDTRESYVPPSQRLVSYTPYAPLPESSSGYLGQRGGEPTPPVVAQPERGALPSPQTASKPERTAPAYAPSSRAPVVNTMVMMGERVQQVSAPQAPATRLAQPTQAPPLANVSNTVATTNNAQTSKQDTTINQSNTFNITAADPNAAGTSVQGSMTSPQFLQQMSPGNNAPTFRG